VNPARIHDEFPASSYRGNQRDALDRIRAAFEDGNEVVLVRAPTGSGKSLLARAVMGCCRRAGEAEPTEATGAYYTTPQVSQLDDVAEDDLLDDLQVIRGKNNYTCILPGEEGTPVDRAPCARIAGYDCAVKHRCPYFSDRAIASSREFAAMTLAYFMHTAGSEVFGRRDVVVIDEAHGLAEWAEMYATIRLDERTVPVWEDLRMPEVAGLDRAVRFAENLASVCEAAKDDLLAQDELTAAEAARRDRLQDLTSDLEWFVDDYRDLDSPTTWVVDQPDGAGGAITIKPVNPERYLHHTVWDRGNKFALLSATILDKDAFCRQVGLDPSRVALVDVEHTFPVENRPLYDVTRGKMTYERRDDTLPEVARVLVRVMQAHPDEKGIVHCHSYDIQKRLHDRLREFGVGPRVRAHDRENRDAALEAWKASDEPEAFLAVKMEEALDLEGDLARWQVVCKAPFRNTGDSRVAQRLEDGQWAWYYRAALRTVVQACGRVVRSPDDHGATYLADSSLLDVFERASSDVPPWFADQIARTTDPDFPAFDPEAAVAEVSVSAPETPTPTESSRDDRAERDDASAASRASGRQTEASDREAGDGRRSPMADVWDTE
jgi:Rad3-related DNA helicase